MAGWDEGYVSDVGYTMGYYNDMSPLRMRLALLHAGWHAPNMETACELGFGQGLSINLHAAASPVQWWGTDFNPAQASFAQGLAEAAGGRAKLFDDAFTQFAERSDIPDFDCITLHGIWSWVSEKNRVLIVDFIRRKLKVGGVAYISYNVQPGWAPFAPMRDLVALHAATMGAPGQGSLQRARAALDFAESLLATNPLYLRANPLVSRRVEDVMKKDMGYVAHEYMNQDWHPMLFADIARELEAAKLQFACSARMLDHVPVMHLTAEQQAMLAGIGDTVLRETVRDFMVNQQFRADLWIKGGRRMTVPERLRRMGGQRVLLTQTPATVLEGKLTSALGEVKFKPEVYGPVLNALADLAPHSLNEVMESAAKDGLDAPTVEQAIVVLAGSGRLIVVADDADVTVSDDTARRLNAELLQRQLDGAGVDYLASPVLGGGFPVSSIYQLLLAAMYRPGAGKLSADSPAALARWVYEVMESRNQRVMQGGKALETAEEALTALTVQAEKFVGEALPLLRALRIAPKNGVASKK